MKDVEPATDQTPAAGGEPQKFIDPKVYQVRGLLTVAIPVLCLAAGLAWEDWRDGFQSRTMALFWTASVAAIALYVRASGTKLFMRLLRGFTFISFVAWITQPRQVGYLVMSAMVFGSYLFVGGWWKKDEDLEKDLHGVVRSDK